jgi:hypothetical protein
VVPYLVVPDQASSGELIGSRVKELMQFAGRYAAVADNEAARIALRAIAPDVYRRWG